ncbi:DNA-directed RNA polymerase subunit beta [Candidatus Deianiraea vastatrix]
MNRVFSVQEVAYREFLLKKSHDSIDSILSTFFPIKCLFGNFVISYISSEVKDPVYSESECIRMGLTYSSDIFVKLKMEMFSDAGNGDKTKFLSGIIEQEVLLFSVPCITSDGRFILNGVERVVVSQIHRSPGLFFTSDKFGSTSVYSASIVPYTGTWIDFAMHNSDFIEVLIDKRKKMPLFNFLFSLGIDRHKIISSFYNKIDCKLLNDKLDIVSLDIDLKNISLDRLKFNLYSKDGDDVIVESGSIVTGKRLEIIKQHGINCKLDDIANFSYAYGDFGNFKSGQRLKIEDLKKIMKDDKKSISLIDFISKDFFDIILREINDVTDSDNAVHASSLLKMLRKTENFDSKDVVNVARSFFFDKSKCNISRVGRYKINTILGKDADSESLLEEDIIDIIKRLILIKEKSLDMEDIDHLGNRRIRVPSELVSNIIRNNMPKLVKSAIDKMSTLNSGVSVSPLDLFTPNQMSKVIKDFFLTSQLSQLMEQTNPLSELGHKRRISALGAGGVERDRVGLEVRDVHFTHYGRICIVETPDSQNIGLINNLSSFAKINDYGFLETPYRVVKNRIITDEIVYLDATKEMKYSISSYNVKYMNDNFISDDIVSVRRGGDFITASAESVDLIDIAPNQALSSIASLIPFLENNDAYRVLMGSNMQRQAVPLVKTEAPLIGTGLEGFIGRKSSGTIKSTCNGIVRYVDSDMIIVSSGDKSKSLYTFNLKRFERTNQSTCINFKPCIKVGDIVSAGQVIADGYSSDFEEIAIGRNARVAFMSWNGYGYEDSVIVSDRFVADDNFTSIHIEEFETSVIDTRLGSEEVTKDIPGLSENAVVNLDESGIVKLGTFVKPGDILVGKLTPKAETPITPEEKLLRAIFDEKIADVKDVSLVVPPGYFGVVVDVDILSRRGINKLSRQIEIESEKMYNLQRDFDEKISVLKNEICLSLKDIIAKLKIAKSSKLSNIPISRELSDSFIKSLSFSDIAKIKVDDNDVSDVFYNLIKHYSDIVKSIENEHKVLATKIREEKDFTGGTLYVVKVRIAMKNLLQPGDKIAGRHGNKGIISKVVPVADMPFTEDGEPVDMIINPLGIVARMNFGQILELGLGLASITFGKKIKDVLKSYKNVSEVKEILLKSITDNNILDEIKTVKDNNKILDIAKKYTSGIPFAVPVFSGLNYEDVGKMLSLAGCDESGQVDLYDGISGQKFDRKVSVGSMYILKLHHLVDRKIHARSVGPYSLITQQPLGGKANFGGQRLGEMECWALEAYGAAYTLNEMLTVKSDDIDGRRKIYSSIVKGSNDFQHGMPESFNVLIKELSSLGLSVSLKD